MSDRSQHKNSDQLDYTNCDNDKLIIIYNYIGSNWRNAVGNKTTRGKRRKRKQEGLQE